MRKLGILAVLAATVCLITADMASARGGRGGCGGGGCGSSYGGCGYSGGCGSSYGGCGSSYGGCGYGGYASVGGCYGHGYVMPYVAPKVEMKKEEGKKPDKEEQIAAPAYMVVTLPTDATLKIDDYQTVSKSATRVFTTPELKPGKEYSYTLTAEVVRDGKPVKVEQVVKVRAGATTPVTLTLDAAAGVASR